MRISFPNGEHTDVAFAEGEVSIGSAPGNRVVLAVEGIAPRHALLRHDPQRGILLEVADGSHPVFVNGREVQEFALLRLGDVLSIGSAQVLLKPERDESIVVQVPPAQSGGDDPTQRAASSRVVLRGVAGAFYGRSISLQDKVLIGRSPESQIRIDDPDIAERAGSFEIHGDRVVFRNLGDGDGAVVNGVPVRDAILHPGDQIAIDVHRFVLEAPGLPSRAAVAHRDAMPVQPGAHAGSTQTMRAVKVDPPTPRPSAGGAAAPMPAPERAGSSRLGWLLVAAAVIAGTLTALFLYGPRG